MAARSLLLALLYSAAAFHHGPRTTPTRRQLRQPMVFLPDSSEAEIAMAEENFLHHERIGTRTQDGPDRLLAEVFGRDLRSLETSRTALHDSDYDVVEQKGEVSEGAQGRRRSEETRGPLHAPLRRLDLSYLHRPDIRRRDA